MHLQVAFLFAQEKGKFFALTALDLLNWNEMTKHEKFKNVSGRSRNDALPMYIHFKNPQISWDGPFKVWVLPEYYLVSLFVSGRTYSSTFPLRYFVSCIPFRFTFPSACIYISLCILYFSSFFLFSPFNIFPKNIRWYWMVGGFHFTSKNYLRLIS